MGIFVCFKSSNQSWNRENCTEDHGKLDLDTMSRLWTCNLFSLLDLVKYRRAFTYAHELFSNNILATLNQEIQMIPCIVTQGFALPILCFCTLSKLHVLNFSSMITGWLHCYILLTQWEPWLFEVGNKYSAERYYWSEWDFPMPCIDFGMWYFFHIVLKS